MNNRQSEANTAFLRRELDLRLSGYHFRNEAILIQVPMISSDLIERDVAINRGYFAYPPHGLLYVSASLHKAGLRTTVLDLNYLVLKEAQKEGGDVDAAWRNALEEALNRMDQPLVCISYMYTMTGPVFREICSHVRKIKPELCIAVGGVSATADPPAILVAGYADFVFSHEGDEAVQAFWAYIRTRTDVIPFNLSFLDSSGNVVHTHRRTGGTVDVDIRDEYSKIPITSYHEAGALSNFSRMNGIDIPFSPLISRRGCRGHCKFCGTRGFSGKGVRVRSTEGVLNEMQHLSSVYGIRHFDWLDDDLLFNRKAALDLFQKMAECLPGITWAANNGLIAASLTPELMGAMERSGCIGFKIGLETGNPENLKAVRKPITLDRFFSFSKMSQEFPGMFVVVNFIIGLPAETFGQMLDSLAAALRASLDWNSFFIYQPIKNTELYTTYADLSVSEGHSRGQGPAEESSNLNPVRGGAFGKDRWSEDTLGGFGIFEHSADLIPSRRELMEIWFTFNMIANFLRMPGIITDSEVRLRNAIRWVDVLSKAYPTDAAMASALYYLNQRLSSASEAKLSSLKDEAHRKLSQSEYWQHRDKQFRFSAFLDDCIPEIPAPVLRKCMTPLS